MEYRKTYAKIIAKAKYAMRVGKRPTTRYYCKYFDEYFEFHHILPQSLYKQYSKNKHNLVCLTAREHFVCHKLLTKIYPCYKMYQALSEFYFRKNDKRSKFFKINSREYENFRKIFSKNQSIIHKNYFEKFTKEQKESAIEKWRNSIASRTSEQIKKTKLLRERLKGLKTEEQRKIEHENRSKSTKAWMDLKTSDWKKDNLGSSSRGKTWWNNGIRAIRSFERPGEEWVKGRIMSENWRTKQKLKKK